MCKATSRKVSVAGGGTLVIDSVIPQCPFSINKVKFDSDFRILDLKGYDVVLGVSWLKQYNPTTFDWIQRTLTITKESK